MSGYSIKESCSKREREYKFILQPVAGTNIISVRPEGKFPKDKLEALQASIEKWKYIVELYKKFPDKKIVDGGAVTCALCHLYMSDGCEGCPVSKFVDETNCEDTPYKEYMIDECLSNALKEVAFLRLVETRMLVEMYNGCSI
jgi:hypothetical protein